MLSDQLRQARGRAGLSIYALAHQSGVGVASISEIESGKNKNPGLLTVAKLADVLDVSLIRWPNGHPHAAAGARAPARPGPRWCAPWRRPQRRPDPWTRMPTMTCSSA